MFERHDGERAAGLRGEHARDATEHEGDGLDLVDALGADHAQAVAPVEIDHPDATAVRADAYDKVTARMRGDVCDRFGQIVRLGLAAIDERDDIDARGVLLRGEPDDAIAAADGGDLRGARELEPAL